MPEDSKRFSGVRVLIFDLDGTLIDSKLDRANSIKAMLEHMGRAQLPHGAIYSFVGNGAPVLVRRALGEGRVDVVTFTSSSTVRHFAALFPGEDLPRLLRGVAVACIGPVTRATARELGLETRIVPREYTIPALARAIADHYARS